MIHHRLILKLKVSHLLISITHSLTYALYDWLVTIGLFLDDIPSMKVYPITPEDDVKTAGYSTISHNYQKIILEQLPKVNNVPVFDYMLLGMGADGHIGSLYGNRSITPHSLPTLSLISTFPRSEKSPFAVTHTLIYYQLTKKCHRQLLCHCHWWMQRNFAKLYLWERIKRMQVGLFRSLIHSLLKYK